MKNTSLMNHNITTGLHLFVHGTSSSQLAMNELAKLDVFFAHGSA